VGPGVRGAHHTKPPRGLMSAVNFSVAGNVGIWKKWHDRTHYGDWNQCPYEPCTLTQPDWRKAWS
jgi:hypothetical protein